MMIAYRRFLAALALLVFLAGCAGSGQPEPVWTSAPDADVSVFSTFRLPKASQGQPASILDTQVRAALREQLLAKGYVESQDEADLLVEYQPVAYEETPGSSPVTIGIGMGTWRRNVGGSVGTSIPVGGRSDDRISHRLAIRAIDTVNERELWIGTTTTVDRGADAGDIDRAVAGVMRGFPARRD